MIPGAERGMPAFDMAGVLQCLMIAHLYSRSNELGLEL